MGLFSNKKIEKKSCLELKNERATKALILYNMNRSSDKKRKYSEIN